MRVLLAGASGVIGARLVPLLVAAGHDVAGTTRSPEKTSALRALGADPVLVDAFDADALTREVASVRPEVVIHQLTDLPAVLDPGDMDRAIARNARMRDEGTRNLVGAALAAGARRLVAQSIAWAYAPGPEPHREADPLDTGAGGIRAVTIGGVAVLEGRTLGSPPLAGLVLRCGRLYGPGTGGDAPAGPAPLHVDAAAFAALLAVDHGGPGIYNIAEANRYASTEKARTELAWDPAFRLPRALTFR